LRTEYFDEYSFLKQIGHLGVQRWNRALLRLWKKFEIYPKSCGKYFLSQLVAQPRCMSITTEKTSSFSIQIIIKIDVMEVFADT